MLKIRKLEHLLEELQELTPENKEEFLASLRIRRSIERQLQIIIEWVIDVCILLVKNLRLTVPTDEESLFDILKDHLTNAQKLKEMKGFRNILVHRYGNIDNEKVFQFFTEEANDFQVFLQDAKRILKDQ